MNTILTMAAGAALVGGGWLGWLTLKHGWGWVLAWLHGRAFKAQAKLIAAVGTALPGVLGPFEQRLLALEQQLGLAPKPAPAPNPAVAPTPAPAPASPAA
jgi:hypothetical protein